VNGKLKILTIITVLALTFSTIGSVAATPKVLKQVNLLYSTSISPDTVPTSAWLPVAGNQVSDFKLKLDGSAASWYYLDIKFIKPTLPAGLTTFMLIPPTDQAFWNYWAAKGVVSSASVGTWQYIMWRIINGQSAMFGLTSDGNGNYMLVDALQKISGLGDNPLRLNGDYPKGTYTFAVFYDNLGLSDVTMTITIK
jgi:hypothetical protein